MNKKLFLGMFAAAGMLLATSCSNDELDVVQSGNEAQVTFSLAAEGGIATRAISDGTGANVLYYAIYDANKELITTISPETNGLFTKPQAFPNGSKQDEVSVTLAKGQEYTAVFWAQNSACTAYEVTAETKGLKIDVDYEGDNNDETRDAFFKAETFKVTGNAKIDVELKRPFAQINVGVTDADWNAAVASGITISESKVVIKNAATSINLLDGTVSGEQAVEYDFAAIPTDPAILEVDVNRNGTIDEDEKYKYLSMSYILTDNNADRTTLEADGLQFTFKSGGADIIFDEGLHAVPVQRNWRTNILGKLLTGDIQFNIVIDERFYDDYNYPEFEEVTNGVKYDAATKTYYLYSVDGLKWLSTETNTNNKSFEGYTVKLTSDVDLNDDAWTPIGQSTTFRGTFDGGNNTISNLTVNGDNTSVGLFGNVIGTIKNVKIANVNLSGSHYAGGIVGYIYGSIENCHVDGGDIKVTVKDGDNGDKAGGIAGYVGEGSYTLSGNTVKNLRVEAYRDVAGIAGCIQAGAKVENNTVDKVTVIANMLQDGGKTVADANADKVVGRNIANTDLSTNTTNNVEVIVLAFDENGVLKLSSGTALKCVAAAVSSGNDMEGKTIKLDADIDLAGIKTDGETFAPIGARTGNDKPFKGTFDGNGKTISNLNQSGWDLGYQWGAFGGLGLFGAVEDATIKNLTIKNMVSRVEGGEIGAIAACAKGDCTFENITIESGDLGTYNNGLGGIVGYTEGGHFVFKDITIGEDVLLGGLWGSFDSSIGGIVGQADGNSSYHFENVEINGRVDAYNDLTAAYKYYAYRMCGMIIGWVTKTKVDENSTTRPDPAANNVTCTNVVVNYGEWMNYTYCDNCYKRLEPGYEYGGHTCDNPEHTHTVRPFDQIFGGGQYGVYGLAAYDGVTVNYPESYNAGE